MSKRKVDLDKMMDRLRRQQQALHSGEIVSSEIGLLKIGAEAAFEVAAKIGNRKIEITTDIYPNGISTEISLYQYKDENQIIFITRDALQPLSSIPEAIEVCGQIRERMQSGLSYETAIRPFTALQKELGNSESTSKSE